MLSTMPFLPQPRPRNCVGPVVVAVGSPVVYRGYSSPPGKQPLGIYLHKKVVLVVLLQAFLVVKYCGMNATSPKKAKESDALKNPSPFSLPSKKKHSSKKDPKESKKNKKPNKNTERSTTEGNTDEEKKTLKTFVRDFPRVAHAALRILKYVFSKSPGFMVLYVVTVVFFTLLPFVNIWLGSLVIDELIGLISNPGGARNTLYFLIGAGVVASAADSFADTLNTVASANLWFKVGRDLRYDFTKKFAHLDYEYYDDPETANQINKVRQNFGARPQSFVTQMLGSLDSVITIISASIIIMAFSPLIVLILLVSSIPVLIINMSYGRRSWGIWAAKGDVSRDFYWTLNYLQQERSLMELKIFRIRKYLLNRLMTVYDDFQETQLKLENKRNVLVFLLSILRLVGRTASYLMIVTAAVATRITIGQLNFYISTVGRLQSGFSRLLRTVARLYEDGLYVADIWDFLDMPEKISPGTVCLPDKETPPKIELRNLTFKYPNKEAKEPALLNTTLTIEPGEHIAIVGENGAGKSTLIKLLMRFYDPTSGHILIDGVNLRDLDLENWYGHVGALFQDFNLYHFTARENIGVGNTDRLDDFESIVDAAKSSGADEFIREYGSKYEQLMSKQFKNGIDPSNGQRQRIALARAFFKDAPILVLDEPTSAIDPKAEYEIFQHLFEFAQGKTVIIISHRFSTVRNAHRILVFDKGEIAETGTHEELMSIEGGKYRTAFELQRKGYE
jgi:ATP-binding cassette, subfamily B, bacterial